MTRFFKMTPDAAHDWVQDAIGGVALIGVVSLLFFVPAGF
jgi:hypothetical protein